MKALILQHSPDTPAGTSIDWLNLKEIPYQLLRLDLGDQFPDALDFQILIICGGAMNVDQEATYPWLRQEKSFIRACIDSGIKVVGLCLGAQLCAEALGAKVQKHPHWEVGWHKISLIPTKNLEIPSAPGSIVAFQYHGYSFSMPEGAEHFASNDICHNQAFTWNDQVLAFQFHPETTLEWSKECAMEDNLPTTGFSQTSEQILEDGAKYQARLQEWYFGILNNFLISGWQSKSQEVVETSTETKNPNMLSI